VAQSLIALITATGAWATDQDAPLLVSALADVGIVAEAAIWDAPEIDWSRFDAAVVRSPWDYVDRPNEFLARLEQVQLSTPVLNPVEVLRWNSDKHYLEDLKTAQIPVVPTRFVSDPDFSTNNLFPDQGRFVVKPTISSGSRNTAQYSQDERELAAAHVTDLIFAGHQVMVQPYVASIDQVGETGLMYFFGEFSHGFGKAALLTHGKAQVGGLYAVETITPRQPSSAQLEVAQQALQVASQHCQGAELLYARVDLLQGPDGQPQVLELELTEPSYFLGTDPSSPARAARAYARALS